MQPFLLQRTPTNLKCQVVWKGKSPIVIENKPVQIAAVPLNGNSRQLRNGKISGDALKDCIIVHPRYVEKDAEHRILKVHGLRLGRTIDVLLDEPFSIAGEKHWIMNFKGVGADADEPMVIHPTQWWWINRAYVQDHWAPRENCDKFGRRWGVVQDKEAWSEMNEDVMQPLGIDMVMHVQANKVPWAVIRQIEQVTRLGNEDLELSQIVRACKTNMRMITAYALGAFNRYGVNAERIAEIDAKILSAQIRLAQRQEMLGASGDMLSNRYVDGTLTDSENFALKQFEIYNCMKFIALVVHSSISVLEEAAIPKYLETLAKKTGIPFDKKPPVEYYFDYEGKTPLWLRYYSEPYVPVIVEKSTGLMERTCRGVLKRFGEAVIEWVGGRL
ncbi:MAG: hypothetical protein NTX79_00800 [Candidatus Micrarchaeota archaeon]|nr:hypothetical protein [Candidatus Micrarchaeota archaeon]